MSKFFAIFLLTITLVLAVESGKCSTKKKDQIMERYKTKCQDKGFPSSVGCTSVKTNKQPGKKVLKTCHKIENTLKACGFSCDVLAEASGSGEWCERPRSFITGYDLKKDTFYASVDEAKAACEADETCGAVAECRLPFREPGGPVIHSRTIYLVSADVLAANHIRMEIFLYNNYVKGACE